MIWYRISSWTAQAMKGQASTHPRHLQREWIWWGGMCFVSSACVPCHTPKLHQGAPSINFPSPFVGQISKNCDALWRDGTDAVCQATLANPWNACRRCQPWAEKMGEAEVDDIIGRSKLLNQTRSLFYQIGSFLLEFIAWNCHITMRMLNLEHADASHQRSHIQRNGWRWWIVGQIMTTSHLASHQFCLFKTHETIRIGWHVKSLKAMQQGTVHTLFVPHLGCVWMCNSQIQKREE